MKKKQHEEITKLLDAFVKVYGSINYVFCERLDYDTARSDGIESYQGNYLGTILHIAWHQKNRAVIDAIIKRNFSAEALEIGPTLNNGVIFAKSLTADIYKKTAVERNLILLIAAAKSESDSALSRSYHSSIGQREFIRLLAWQPKPKTSDTKEKDPIHTVRQFLG